MTDAPKDRVSHIRRYIGTNKAGDQLPHLWADMLRTDKFSTIYNGGTGPEGAWPTNQKIKRTLFWADDPTSDNGGVGNEHIEFDILKLCSPDEDPTDPTEWIEIPVTRTMITKATRLSDTGQGTDNKKKVTFHTPDANTTEDTGREFTVVKVTHKDTNIDGNPDFDNGGIIALEEYVKFDDTENTGDYVNACILTSYKTRASHETGSGQGDDQKKKVRLRNDFLIEQFSPPDTDPASAPPFNPPWTFDPYQILYNVKFRSLYLLVTVIGGNNSFNLFSGASPAGSPVVSTRAKKDGVRLLDTVLFADGNNSTSSFGRCFSYVEGASEREAWLQSRGLLPPDFNDGTALFGEDFAPTGDACPWPGGGDVPFGLTVAPTAFSSSSSVAKAYLYSIPAGDGLASIDVGGILPNFISSGLPLGERTTSGSVTMTAQVYSTTRKKVTKIDQLLDLAFDGKPRPTQDDTSILNLTSANQGRFVLDVQLDTDPTHKQIDNYGKEFQPYKVTFDPGTGATDHIPLQPPPSLL